MKKDFSGLADRLLSESSDWLPRWLPHGRIVGHEYTLGDLIGNPGDSLKINMKTGLWKDFSTGDAGRDLLSLYAAIRGIKNGEAYAELNENLPAPFIPPAPVKPKRILIPVVNLTAPAEGTPAPDMVHFKHGKPSMNWCYRNPEGNPMFYVARYNEAGGKKNLTPWSWDGTGWIARGWNAPRPLYGLEQLEMYPKKPVLIVEGEKTAEAAKKIVGDRYCVMTWPNGSMAVSSAEWEPIHGRSLLLCGDADEHGSTAVKEIASKLSKYCKSIKIIDTTGQPDGWDLADVPNWTWENFSEWAKPRAKLYGTPVPEPEPVPVPVTVNNNQLNIQINRNRSQDMPTDEAAVSLWERLGISVQGNGQPFCNMDSILSVLETLPGLGDLIWYDEFYVRNYTRWDPVKSPLNSAGVIREWSDIDDRRFTRFIQQQIGIKRISKDVVIDALKTYASTNIKNAPRDWVDSLEWDGVKRVNEFFHVCFDAQNNEYTRAVSANFFIGLAARIYDPGCQLDNMIVLEGSQGVGKSRALRLLGSKAWYASAKDSIQKNDFFQVLQGKLLIEISELDSFKKAGVTRIKQVISDPIDRYRTPYEQYPQDHARTCVFIATTNEDEYLHDNTGGRRFWPIKCGAGIAYDLIEKIRPQLFAEAKVRFKAGEEWHLMPEITAEEQELRRYVDEWEGIICDYLEKNLHYDSIATFDLAQQCFKIYPSELDTRTQSRINNIFRHLKWTRSIVGDNVRVWSRPVS